MKLRYVIPTILSTLSMGLAHAQVEAGHISDSVSTLVRHASGTIGVGDAVSSTEAVPEFGLVAAVVLAIAISAIVVVSVKTRLRFMPKY